MTALRSLSPVARPVEGPIPIAARAKRSRLARVARRLAFRLADAIDRAQLGPAAGVEVGRSTGARI